jgi:hypothetical protein
VHNHGVGKPICATIAILDRDASSPLWDDALSYTAPAGDGQEPGLCKWASDDTLCLTHNCGASDAEQCGVAGCPHCLAAQELVRGAAPTLARLMGYEIEGELP